MWQTLAEGKKGVCSIQRVCSDLMHVCVCLCGSHISVAWQRQHLSCAVFKFSATYRDIHPVTVAYLAYEPLLYLTKLKLTSCKIKLNACTFCCLLLLSWKSKCHTYKCSVALKRCAVE